MFKRIYWDLLLFSSARKSIREKGLLIFAFLIWFGLQLHTHEFYMPNHF